MHSNGTFNDVAFDDGDGDGDCDDGDGDDADELWFDLFMIIEKSLSFKSQKDG